MKRPQLIGPNCREWFIPVAGNPALRLHGITLGGISDLRGDYVINRERTSFHALIFTIAGKGWVDAPSIRCDLEPGSLLVNVAGEHHYYGLADESWQIAWLHLSDIDEWTGFKQAKSYCVNSRGGPALWKLLDAFVETNRIVESTCSSTHEQFSQLIVDHLHRQARHLGEPQIGHMRNRVLNAFHQARAQLTHRWTVAELARLAGMSSTHFTRSCRRVFGCSPMKQLTKLRLQRGESLLRSTFDTVEAVAEQVGYANAFSFSLAMKRETGKSPSDYRQ